MIQIGNSGTMTDVFYSIRAANNTLKSPTIQLMKSGKDVAHGTGCSSVISIQINKFVDNNTTVSINSWDPDNETPVTDVRTLSNLNNGTYIQNAVGYGINMPYNLDNTKTVVLLELVGEESTSIPYVYFVGFYEGKYQHEQPDANCLYGIKISCSTSKVLDYELFNNDIIENGYMVLNFNARKEIKMISSNFSSVTYMTNNEDYICGYMLIANDNAAARAITTLFHTNDDENDTYSIHIGSLNNIKLPGTQNKFGEVVLAENVSNFWDNGKSVSEYDLSEVDLSRIQEQINELDGSIDDINDSIDDINDEIEGLPAQIEEAVDEATSSIISQQAQLYVAR